MASVRTDSTWQRFGEVILAGSPFRLFRTTARGSEVAAAIESGEELPDDAAVATLVDRLLDAGAVHPVLEHAPTRYSVGDVTIVTPQFGRSPSGPHHPGTADHPARIVVDDGSEPPLAGATVRLESNAGPAAARNAGRALVATPLIAFVDADVTVDVEPEAGASSRDPQAWLTPLLRHFDDPAVGLVAPRIVGERDSPLDLGPEPARIRAGTRVSYVPGAVIVVRADAFDSIGGFDEGLRFGEDVDLVWRLDEARWRCRYEPTATAWHAPRTTWRARLRQHAGYGTSAAPLALRHPGSLSPLDMNGWTVAAWVTLVLGHPIVAATTAIGSAAALIPKLRDVPPRASFELAMRGHLSAGTQLATALRRVWWPPVVLAALCSRRVRWIAVAALVADLRAAPTDMAYGWGVWRGMARHRTWSPVIPRISAWPPKRGPHRQPPKRGPRADR